MGTRALPDMYALSPRACGPRASGIHIRQSTRAHVITYTSYITLRGGYHCYYLGLGGIAILVFDISDRKKIAILLFIAIFTKTCELTVLLESFDLFTDLALQVPGFCLQ